MGKAMWHLILKDGLPFKPFRKKDLNTTSATTVHEEVAVDPSSDQKVPVDESKEIHALLELELAMIHQLEYAAISGAGGAQSTAEKLSTIRSQTEALAQRTNDAQTTAATISRMPVVDD